VPVAGQRGGHLVRVPGIGDQPIPGAGSDQTAAVTDRQDPGSQPARAAGQQRVRVVLNGFGVEPLPTQILGDPRGQVSAEVGVGPPYRKEHNSRKPCSVVSGRQ
jgi:hypothetical protein